MSLVAKTKETLRVESFLFFPPNFMNFEKNNKSNKILLISLMLALNLTEKKQQQLAHDERTNKIKEADIRNKLIMQLICIADFISANYTQ